MAYLLLLLTLGQTIAPPAPADSSDLRTSPPPPPIENLEGVEDISELSLEGLLDVRITTASRLSERAYEAPATVYVITRQDIRARGYSVLTDVLADLPGMETVEQYYSEQGTLVPVRGVVGNNKIVLLVNGTRVNPPGGEELMLRGDVSVRFAEQIEIIYGPGSTLYGQDAISAVINIKTRRGETAEGSELEAVARYGNHDSAEGFAGFSLRLTESPEPVQVSGFVAGRFSHLANFRTAHEDWWAFHQQALASVGRSGDPDRLTAGLNALVRVESASASLQLWYRESARSSAEGSGEGGPMPVLFFVEESRWRDRSLVIDGQHRLRLAEQLQLTSLLTFNRYQVDPSSRYVFPNGMGGLFLDDFKYGTGTGASLEEKLDWSIGRSAHLTVGVVGANYDVVPKATVLGGADPDDGVVTQAGILSYYTRQGDPTSRVDIARTVDLHYQQYGAYAEGSVRFAGNFRAIAGLRVDLNTRYDDIPLSPRAALIYTGLGQRLTLKYIFSQAYVSPAPYFEYNVFDNGRQISSGNPKLSPERALSNEVNATWQDERFMLSASAYYNRQSNLLLTSQSEEPETVISPMVWADAAGTQRRTLTRSINLGKSEVWGGDLFGRANLRWVSLWASYSLVDFTRTLNGRSSGLPQISAHNVRAGLTATPLPSLSVTPSFSYRSTPSNLTPNYRGMGISLSNPYQLNLHALYTPFRQVDLFLDAVNLTNKKYALRGVSGPAPQEPLTISGGARVRLSLM